MSTPQPPSTDSAYLDWVKAWTDEDRKVILLLIAFDLATISLILSNKTGTSVSGGTRAGLLLLLISAGCLYLYFSGLHLVIRNLKPNGIALSPDEIDRRFDEVRIKKMIWFHAGSVTLIAGVIVLMFALLR